MFNTFAFLYFFLVVFTLYWVCPWPRARKILILCASYLFYSWWNPAFVSLLLYSTVLDFSIGRGLARSEDPRIRRYLVTASLIGNLGVLGIFKYTNFLIESANPLLHALRLGNIPLVDIVLPVGISFYTFQTLSYTIDVYRGRIAPENSFLDYATYVSFFPQLVAGPIVRARDFLPQLRRMHRFSWPRLSQGIYEIIYGLFLKITLADHLGAKVVQPYFSSGWLEGDPVAAWWAVYGFSFQVFGDFAGYSLIAIGVARTLGFQLRDNFNYPFISTSFREYWTRWHISLSQWLRDYLFFSLGGNRGGAWRTQSNLILTMLLGGLWHGAAWTYVAWGGLNGLYLVVERSLGLEDRPTRSWSRVPIAIFRAVIVFQLIGLSHVVFRSESIPQALSICGIMAEIVFVDPSAIVRGVLSSAGKIDMAIFMAIFGCQFVAQKCPSFVPAESLRSLQPASAAAMVLLLFLLGGERSAFIYFQF